MNQIEISRYELVKEADAIGLSEKDAMLYFKGSGTEISRVNYFKLKKRVNERKRDMLFIVAKHLPEVHITQITSLQIIKKKVFTALLSTSDPFEIVALAKSLIEIERVISEYNGWTQKLTEETLKKYGQPENKKQTTVPISF